LTTIFDKVAEPGWTWFEQRLTYDNAKLAHALIVSGRATGYTGVYERGIQALRWLVGVQTSQHGRLRPIGSNGFYTRNAASSGWLELDNNPDLKMIASGEGLLFELHKDGSIWWYVGPACSGGYCPGWVELNNNPLAVTIGAGPKRSERFGFGSSPWKSRSASGMREARPLPCTRWPR
jgi:hypothetical protein